MSQYIEGNRKTFTAGTALEAHRRVKITAATGDYGPTIGYAGASDPSIGVTEDYHASGSAVSIYLANAPGTRKMMATAAAITANNPVYAAASGYVASTGTIVEGKAMETTAGASGDILEVMPQPNSVPTRDKTVTTPVAAAGTDHTNGGQLARAKVVHITSDGATKGVLLPAAVDGDSMIVINDSGTAAEIYAALGGTINGGAANASYVVPASKGVWCFATGADTWVIFDMTARASAS